MTKGAGMSNVRDAAKRTSLGFSARISSVRIASSPDPAPFPLIDLNLAATLSDCGIEVSRQEFAFVSFLCLSVCLSVSLSVCVSFVCLNY